MRASGIRLENGREGFLRALAVAALLGAAPAAHAAEEKIAIPSEVSVSAIRPEGGDSDRIEAERRKSGKQAFVSGTAAPAAGEAPVYMVKIYVELPPVGNSAMRLFVGDEQVKEFGSFKGGLFIKVYDRSVLAKWAGKPLRMARGKGQPQDMGKNFPEDSQMPSAGGDARTLERASESLSK